MKRQGGFTLIEVMVVVLIIATLAAISVFAVEQVTGRRLVQQASDLENWLNDLPDRAILEGTAYGVRPDRDGLHAMVYFRNRWFTARSPEPFLLPDDVEARWFLAADQGGIAQSGTPQHGDAPLLPLVAVLPSGQFMPAGRLEMRSESSTTVFRLNWGGEESGIQLSTVVAP